MAEKEIGIIFDLEANGLYQDATRIHCIAYYDSAADQTFSFNDECPGKGMSSPITTALGYMAQAAYRIGHKIIGDAIPLIRKLYPWFNPMVVIVDTLLLSRLYHSRLMSIDKVKNWKHMPLQLYGRHSLEAYGYRLGEYKGSFSKDTDWKEWSQEMEDYCTQDVNVTRRLWKHFHPYLIGSR